MQTLTQAGDQAVFNLSQRYGVSADAVRTLLFAVAAGGGTMAQFYHSDLGGGGQWMSGGMTMVGDMFNHGLQATVSGLCSELSALLRNEQLFAPAPQSQNGGFGFMASGNNWWPSELGSPSSSGGQNDSRYAYFPNARRLAISRNGQITIYDTLDHSIGGVQQQQGGPSGSLSFSSQFGTFTVDSLPMVGPQASPPQNSNWQPDPAPQYQQAQYQQPQYQQPQYQQPSYQAPPQETRQSYPSSSGATQSHDDVLNALERLGNLHQKGVISDDEFRAKKAELLARL